MKDWPAAERNYEFRRRLEVVHAPDQRDAATTPGHDEIAVGRGWSIAVGAGCEALVLDVAKDLQVYLLTSMHESVLLRQVDDVAAEARSGERVIVLGTRDELGGLGAELSAPRSSRLVCEPGRLVVCGYDARGACQGSYYLEDLMQLREAPFVRAQDVTRESLFSPRMTHSGWGLDEFPDAHLSAIAHAGMDAVLVFANGVDRAPDEFTHDHPQPYGGKHVDFNDLVDRVERFGLDVYFYAYFRGMRPPHPDDPDAAAFYDGTYGAIFRACPRAKGIVLVGESIEFPSKDPHTSGTLRHLRSAGEPPPDKPTPGWWPAYDWVDWLEMIKRVIRPHNPQADIVFWTYSWGLSGLMENHHYGWWPSYVSELAKWNYWTPTPTTEETLRAIARRDFGEGAPHALTAWRAWSEAIQHYVATGHDQYGPFRIGPSYPLVWQEPAELDVDWYAMHGGRIARTNYSPGMGRNSQLPAMQRLDVPTRVELELRSLQRMEAQWRWGVEEMARAITLAPARKREAAAQQLGIGRFILHAVVTVVHTKQWWLLKRRVLGGPAAGEAMALLGEMAELAEREIANAAAAIPLVRADSRLGWEPTMGYLTDEAHLRWKIAHVRRVLEHEIPRYRRSLEATEPGLSGRGK